MPNFKNPSRTRSFRLLTIASAGLGSMAIGAWGLQAAIGPHVEFVSSGLVSALAGALCALGAAMAATAFYAGVDESADYVYHATQVDKLTGLPARAAMIGKLADAVAATRKTGKPLFLLDIDIDRFKQVNEAIGYAQGDQLIRMFARRLGEVLPRGVTIGRLGAGEFGILLSEADLGGSLDSFTARLIGRLMQPYQLAAHLQSVNVSVGAVAIPKDGDTPDVLLRRSNLALRHARASGVGDWAAFDHEMGQLADQRRWIEAELNSAFERGDFHLHYQPQLDLLSGRTVGYEALIRWNHPERGMISPAEFIPVAEETGMIYQLGNWVLRRACEDAQHLPADCFVAVNISAVQFMARDFVGIVRNAIQATGLAPSRLELEITETAMMQDRERGAAVLTELAGMGVSVAVDDFGTGYSNLSFLIDFPFHKLKIDRSFVSRMETDSNSGAVISTIVGLSRALGVHTIAEGVETEAQATLLKAAGCKVVQGYYFGRPRPLEQSAGRDGGRQAVLAH